MNAARTPDTETLSTREGGYVEAFYELAKMMGIGARAQPPQTVWEREMKPRLEALLSTRDDGELAALEASHHAELASLAGWFRRTLDGAHEPLSVESKQALLQRLNDVLAKIAAAARTRDDAPDARLRETLEGCRAYFEILEETGDRYPAMLKIIDAALAPKERSDG